MISKLRNSTRERDNSTGSVYSDGHNSATESLMNQVNLRKSDEKSTERFKNTSEAYGDINSTAVDALSSEPTLVNTNLHVLNTLNNQDGLAL